jgi:hypothetical protein
VFEFAVVLEGGLAAVALLAGPALPTLMPTSMLRCISSNRRRRFRPDAVDPASESCYYST